MPKTTEQLYAELKDDVIAVADPLFELSEELLRKHGNFLPHGFVLNDEGKNTIVAATDHDARGSTTSTMTLPLLHQGIRKQVESGKARAIGVAENVTITLTDGETTNAIKVMFEHRDGLCLALYLPFKNEPLSRYRSGQIFTVAAEPEIKAWHPR